MKIHTDEFAEGIRDILELHKQGSNIFDMKGGSLFPHHTSQKTWQYSKKDGHVHFSDGTQTYSFKGDLTDYDSQLERMPDAPLSDIFTNAHSKGKAQVHRSDPGSIYFTLQEGRNNPTYTLKHEGDNRWKAIPKAKKLKEKLKEPITPHNVNLEHVKQGMQAELAIYTKQADDGFFHNLNMGAGKAVQGIANLPARLALLPARMTGPVTYPGDPDPSASSDFETGIARAATAGLAGAGLGGLYHLAKRNFLNTDEENAAEDQDRSVLAKRIAAPALASAGLNIAGRSLFPNAVNNPEMQMFD